MPLAWTRLQTGCGVKVLQKLPCMHYSGCLQQDECCYPQPLSQSVRSSRRDKVHLALKVVFVCLFVTARLHHFSDCCDQISDKNQGIRKRVRLVLESEGLESIVAEKAGWQRLCDYCPPRDERWHSAHFLLWFTPSFQHTCMVLPTYRVDKWTQLTQPGNSLMYLSRELSPRWYRL